MSQQEAAYRDALGSADTWIFDLDNTLYPHSSNLFAQIDVKMGAFVSELLNLPQPKAREIQKQYFYDHGTTLNGLMINHKIEPAAFLDFVHDIDYTPVAYDPILLDAIDRLPGRKLIYTNGTVKHAESVLERLKMADRFEAIFDIVASDYAPKPQPEPYHKFLRDHDVEPAGAVFFEDMAKNLRVPAALGMSTVWIETGAPRSSPIEGEDSGHIHHRTDDLSNWLSGLVTWLEERGGSS